MPDTLKELIALLNVILNDDKLVIAEYNNEQIDEHYPTFGSLVDSCIIGEAGRVNYDAVNTLTSQGFKVGPGETDSFGWVTGIIQTGKGIYVF